MARRYRYCHHCGAELDPEVAAGGFMNREWDGGELLAFQPELWQSLMSVCYPGAWVFAYASSRGHHRVAVAMEDAGLVYQPDIFVENIGPVETRGHLIWATGQAFPKATRIDTVLDKCAGAEREVIGRRITGRAGTRADKRNADAGFESGQMMINVELPATPLARAWEGHRYGGQVLRDMALPILTAQKPWTNSRLVCIVDTGAGALNVNGSRVVTDDGLGRRLSHRSKTSPIAFQASPAGAGSISDDWKRGRWPPNYVIMHHPMCRRLGVERIRSSGGNGGKSQRNSHYTEEWWGQAGGGFRTQGRSTVTHADADGTESIARYACARQCVECGHIWTTENADQCPECGEDGEWLCAVRLLDEQAGYLKSGGYPREGIQRSYNGIYGKPNKTGKQARGPDEGGPSRFYPNPDYWYETSERLALGSIRRYCAKPGPAEKDAGLEDLPLEDAGCYGEFTGDGRGRQTEHTPAHNPHTTVKPISLNVWLATLLLPPKEYAPRRLLIPFGGSGSEAIGAILAGWDYVTLIEQSQEFCDIAEGRLKWWSEWSHMLHTTDVRTIHKESRGGGDDPPPDLVTLW